MAERTTFLDNRNSLQLALSERVNVLERRKFLYKIASVLQVRDAKEEKELISNIIELLADETKAGCAKIDDATKVKYCINLFLTHPLFVKHPPLRDELLGYICSFACPDNKAKKALIKLVSDTAATIKKPKKWQLYKKAKYNDFLSACAKYLSELEQEDFDAKKRSEGSTKVVSKDTLIPTMPICPSKSTCLYRESLGANRQVWIALSGPIETDPGCSTEILQRLMTI